jgi:hypothetical protein
MNKMKVVFNPGVAERAEKIIRVIVYTYFLPNKTLSELHAMTASGALEPLRDADRANRLQRYTPKPTFSEWQLSISWLKSLF